MSVHKRGHGVEGIRWIDPDGVPHIILEMMLGDRVVWDGHVHQMLQVLRAITIMDAYDPDVSASAKVACGVTATGTSEAKTPDVSAGVTINPPLAASTLTFREPSWIRDQNWDIDTATGDGDMLGGEFFATSAVMLNAPAVGSGEAFAPGLTADVWVDVPTATGTGEMRTPIIESAVFVTPPTATVSGEAFAPEATATAETTPPAATGTGVAPTPTVTGQGVEPTTAAGSGQAFIPWADVSTDVPVATGTATAPAPALSWDNTVYPATATSTGYAPDPTVTGDTIPIPAATGSGQAYAPTPTWLVDAPTATGAGQAFPADGGAGAIVTPPTATGTGQAFAPDATGASTVTPDTATGTGYAPDPAVSIPQFTDMQARLSSDFAATNAEVSGWQPDPAYPATQVVGNKIVVVDPGSVRVDLTANVYRWSAGVTVTLAVTQNGATVWTSPNLPTGPQTVGVNLSVAAGDQIGVNLQTSYSNSGIRNGATFRIGGIGAVASTITPDTATGSGQAFAPTVTGQGIEPTTATGTGYAPDAMMVVTTDVPTVTGSGNAPDPEVTSGVTQAPNAATGTGQAFAVDISAITDISVATGSGQAFDPMLSATTDVPIATGSGAAPSPDLSGSHILAIPAATGTGQGLDPTVEGLSSRVVVVDEPFNTDATSLTDPAYNWIGYRRWNPPPKSPVSTGATYFNLSGSVSSDSDTYRPPVALAANQWAEITLDNALTGTNTRVGIVARYAGTGQGYQLLLSRNTWWLRLCQPGTNSSTTLKTGSIVPAAGDVYRLEVVGSTIAAFCNDVPIDSVVNTVVTAGDYAGLTVKDGSRTDGAITQFRCGTM